MDVQDWQRIARQELERLYASNKVGYLITLQATLYDIKKQTYKNKVGYQTANPAPITRKDRVIKCDTNLA